MPDSFPPWRTVYTYYWLWTRCGLWTQINTALVEQVRKKSGRRAQPMAQPLDGP